MAFDGITVAAVTDELNKKLTGGRIAKVAQPEKDELMLTVKGTDAQYRLVLSANPTLPLAYIAYENKVSPAVAPSFSMLLRKHIQNGRIVSIYQPDFERIIVIEIEHLDEMGDLCHKKLITELMGKYSNIILTDDKDMILDSIRHVNAMVSSVREVLPGLTYFIPRQEGKCDPLKVTHDGFVDRFGYNGENIEPARIIMNSFTGISPMMAYEICEMARDDSAEAIWDAFSQMTERVRANNYSPRALYENGRVKDYSMIPVHSYDTNNIKCYDTPSELIISFYREKEQDTRAKQKSADLRNIVKTILERDVKKYDLQLKQLKDTEKMDKYKVYGELLHTYGYEAKDGDRSLVADNYYTGEKITIPLDPTVSVMDNASKYFDKYNKLKRTKDALTELTVEVKAEIDHLESILNALDFAYREEDINEIRQELLESGYIKGGYHNPKGSSGKNKQQKQRFKSKPLHYISSDGYHMYVGKNNFQNDELTFKLANGGDWWFHAKGIPGSHVIVKTEGEELPDTTFEEAGRLAAHFSKGNGSDKVEIDYLQRKNVKKPNGAKPGYVIYYTNYSMTITSNIDGIEQVAE